MVLTFSKALAAASLSRDDFTLLSNIRPVADPTISGKEVTFQLASGGLGLNRVIRVAYKRPTGTNNRLVDVDGNTLESFSFAGTFSDTTAFEPERAYFDNSQNADRIRIFFSRPTDPIAMASLSSSSFTVKKTTASGTVQTLTLSGNPTSSNNLSLIDLHLASGSLTASDAGVTVSYTKPTSGTNNAIVAWYDRRALASFSDFAVENRTRPSGAPGVSSASVNGTSLVLTFDETLGAAASLSNAAFSVTRTPPTGSSSTQAVALTGSPAISGKTVTLTLSSAILPLDGNVRVTYRRPATGTANRIVDSDGNVAADFTATADNATPDPDAPTVVSAVVNNTSLVVTFSKALDPGRRPDARQFIVRYWRGDAWTSSRIVGFSISGRTVTFGIRSSLRATDVEPTVAYTRPRDHGSWLSDRDGNVVAEFSEALTRSAVPVLHLATVSGTTLTLTFSESLRAAASLAKFTVKKTPAGGNEQTAALTGAPSISGPTVTLTLATAFSSTDGDVKVSYTKPGSGTNNKLADAAGNEVASFADRAVVNATPDSTRPPVQ